MGGGGGGGGSGGGGGAHSGSRGSVSCGPVPELHGLMMVSGFRSAKTLFADYSAGGLIPAHAFNNVANVRRLAPSVPLFLVHGERDELIASGHSRRLYDVSRSANKRIVLQKERTHIDVRFLAHLERFVLAILRPPVVVVAATTTAAAATTTGGIRVTATASTGTSIIAAAAAAAPPVAFAGRQ